MFAQRIINLREQKGMYQKDLAEIFNIEQATISNWEKGKRVPDSDMLIKISQFFNVSIDYLLGNENNNKTAEKDLKDKEIFKSVLQKAGYTTNNENISNKELENIIKFIVHNKEFFKEK